MPMYDLTCPSGHEQLDVFLKIGERPSCPTCGQPTETLWRGKSANVVDDSIPGGVEIRHGICNEDGTPRRYYSHSEINAEAKRRGYKNIVTHVTDPRSGSDKSPHTTRWVGVTTVSEEDRLKRWYEHESQYHV